MTKYEARAAYDAVVLRDPPINFQRGYLGVEQLDYTPWECVMEDVPVFEVEGEDIRNYSKRFIEGLPAARELFGNYLGVKASEVIIYAQTARRVIHDICSRACLKGVGGYAPWNNRQARAQILCPVPGYDNHHHICEDVGLSMIPVPMRGNGPDMDVVEHYCRERSDVKAIICVPQYHNPTGITYSADTVLRLSRMDASPDFRIIWDCTYLECHYGRHPDKLMNIMDACRVAGNPDRPLLVFSTSKITTPAYSIAGVAGSERNVAWMRELVKVTSGNPGLLNQLAHVRFFKSVGSIKSFMYETHGCFLGRKMALVERTLISGLGSELLLADDVVWQRPEGGYSFCVKLKQPCASRVVELAAAKGVLMLEPREMYPYKVDTENRYIRIMPSAVSDDDIVAGMGVVCACIRLALAEYGASFVSDGL